MLYVGVGLIGSKGETELIALEEKTDIPVTTTLMGLGLLPYGHPLNLDGILCMPLPDPARSRIWLRVQEDERLEQLVHQLEKLVDVEQVRRHPADPAVFREMEAFFS